MKKTIYYILALAFVLRIISINQSLWLDEATSASVARDMSMSQIYNDFLPHDFHPPLYYFTLKAWGSVAGFSDISLRLLSVTFGVATVYLVYLIGRTFKDETLGIVSALFAATSPLFIYYSQEVRMYPMAAFFVALSIYAFLNLIKKPKLSDWFIYSASLIGIIMTDYLSILIVPVLLIVGLRLKKKAKWMRKFLMQHVVLLVSAAATWPIFSRQLLSGIGVKSEAPSWWNILGKTNLKNLALVPIKFTIGRVGFDNKAIYAIVVLIVFSGFSFLFWQALKKYKKYNLFWLYLCVPLTIAAIAGFFLPVFVYFRFLFVLPAFYILLALGVLSLKENYFMPALSFVVIVNLFFSGMYLSNAKFQREDWRGLVSFVQSETKDRDYRVIFPADSQMEAYHYYAPGAPLFGPGGVEVGHDIIWLMRYVSDIFDPNDDVRKSVEALGYKKISEHSFNGVVVWRYENSN